MSNCLIIIIVICILTLLLFAIYKYYKPKTHELKGGLTFAFNNAYTTLSNMKTEYDTYFNNNQGAINAYNNYLIDIGTLTALLDESEDLYSDEIGQILTRLPTEQTIILRHLYTLLPTLPTEQQQTNLKTFIYDFNRMGKFTYNLSIDYLMIVGKYFKTNRDFINLMKVNKQYKDLALMYHFNPIGDTSLFENMETQHFYNKDDVKNKEANKYQYIYHFGDKELQQNKKANEIFIGDEINYLYRQVPLLNNWCGKEFDKIIYDSDEDENKNDNGATLFAKIKDKPNLYFIIIDSNENIFGFYVNKEITREIGKYDDLFMFSLRSNENEPKKFPVLPDYKHSFVIRFWKLENDIISIQAGIREGFPLSLSCYGEYNSYIGNRIDRVFKDANKFYFTGETPILMPGGHVPFILKRLIIIEMK